MELPCKCCKHEKITHNGIRIFVGCDNKEREKQFVYDDLFYWHKCKGQEVMDKCLNCIHYEKPYCNSIKAKDENKMKELFEDDQDRLYTGLKTKDIKTFYFSRNEKNKRHQYG